MSKKKVTAKDVAELAGVSQTTVSMVLNNYKNISFSDETRQRIFKACEELGYTVSGKTFRSGEQSRIILIVCPSLHNPHYVKVINSAQQRAVELGFEPLLFCTQRSEDQEVNLVSLCRQLNVGGVLLTYHPYNSSAYHLLSMELPLVLVYDKSAGTDTNMIELDNYKIGRIIAEHLIGLGHKYIAHVSRPLHKSQPARYRRIEGLQSVMIEAGLDPEKYLKVCTVKSEGLKVRGELEGYETGLYLGRHILEKYPEITAFSATNDVVAYGIVDAIMEKGKRVPQDYSVVGADNIAESALHRMELTSVDPFSSEKGRDAIDVLVKKIQLRDANGESDSPRSFTRIEYPPKLVVRKTTGKCPR